MNKAPEPGSIEELIERSSLGTPEALAIRRRAPRAIVERVLARAREIDADGAQSDGRVIESDP